MNVRRNWLFFLVMLLLSASAILLAAQGPLTESWNTLRGAGSGSWQAVGAGPGDVSAVAGWNDGALAVNFFKQDGTALSTLTTELPDELAGGTVARVVPLRDGVAVLGIYGKNAETLYLFRVGAAENAERLLEVSCAGDSFEERVGKTAVSEFACDEGVVYFAVRTGNTLER